MLPAGDPSILYMASHPHIEITVESQHFQLLERFTVILYDKASNHEFVNEARRELFCQKNRTMHQRKMHCCSTANVLHIRLESGPPVI